jgi:hypothetical protein
LKVSYDWRGRPAHGGDSLASDLETDPSGPGTCSWSPPGASSSYIVPRGVRSPASGTGEKRLLVAPSKRPRAFSPAPTFGRRISLEFCSSFVSNDSFSTHRGPTSFGAASFLVPAGAGRTTARDRDPQVARDDVRPGTRGRPLVDGAPYREGAGRPVAPAVQRRRLRRAHGNHSLGNTGSPADPPVTRCSASGLESPVGPPRDRPGEPRAQYCFHLGSSATVPGGAQRELPSHRHSAAAEPGVPRHAGRLPAPRVRPLPHPARPDR